MARFRKVDVRTWVDKKFRELTPIPPCGQGLWLYLLTNPDTVNIPGLYRAGEAQMAEALGWSLKAFQEAFREAYSKGMVKADWKARVVWIPKAIEYNQPESPNVIIGWSKMWDEIPDCELKEEAYHTLKHHIETSKALKKGFMEAFRKVFAKDYAYTGAGTGAGTGIKNSRSSEPVDNLSTTVDQAYIPSETVRVRLRTAGCLIDPLDSILLEKFKSHHQAKGTITKHWDAAYVKWCLDEWSRRGTGHGNKREKTRAEESTDQLASIAAGRKKGTA